MSPLALSLCLKILCSTSMCCSPETSIASTLRSADSSNTTKLSHGIAHDRHVKLWTHNSVHCTEVRLYAVCWYHSNLTWSRSPADCLGKYSITELISLQFQRFMAVQIVTSSAVTDRSCDASCVSTVGFNIQHFQRSLLLLLLVSYFSFTFTNAYN